jgi:hypothetical protein
MDEALLAEPAGNNSRQAGNGIPQQVHAWKGYKMKSILRYTAAGLALATVGFASNASAADASATVSAQIVDNLQLASTTGLSFGSITAPLALAANAAVTVSPALTPTVTCAATLTSCGGTPTAAAFSVTGFPSQSVTVSILDATIQLDRGAALGTMQRYMDVNAFTTSATTVALSGTGLGSFYVGGTLNVRPNQAPGVYTGSVNVRVAYN